MELLGLISVAKHRSPGSPDSSLPLIEEDLDTKTVWKGIIWLPHVTGVSTHFVNNFCFKNIVL
jgi:hypothetical protein